MNRELPTSAKVILDPEIEIYRIYVESAERNIGRRLEANRYYFSVVAALFVVYAFLVEGKLEKILAQGQQRGVLSSLSFEFGVYFILPLLLFVVSVAWFITLRGFRALSTAKYSVITDMEKQLPLSPFEKEWAHLNTNTRLPGVTIVEMIVPLLMSGISIMGIILPAYTWFGASMRP